MLLKKYCSVLFAGEKNFYDKSMMMIIDGKHYLSITIPHDQTVIYLKLIKRSLKEISI